MTNRVRQTWLQSRKPALTAAYFIAVTLGYTIAGFVGLRWATVDGVASPVWPAAGIGLAGLLLGGVWLWPAVFLGTALAYTAAGTIHPWWVELILAGGNALAAAVSACLLRHLGFDLSLRRTWDVVALMLVGAVGGAAIASTVGTATLWATASLSGGTVPLVWVTWWLGDATGVLVATPLILGWASRPPSFSWRWWGHFLACLVLTVFVGVFVFISDTMDRPFTFYVLVPLVWAAIAFHVRGVAAAIAIVASLAIWGATSHSGPFADNDLGSLRIIFLQQFIIVAAATMLFLAVVADERRGKEALQASEERLRLYRDRMPIGCILHGRDFTILDWNPACEEIFSFTREEAVGRSPFELIVPPEADNHVRQIEAKLQSGDLEAHSVNENITKDGRRIVCEWHNTPLVGESGLIGFLAMVQDVTERTRSEEALREADRRKDDFLATLAHELRNPLAPISNALEVWPLIDNDPAKAEELQALMSRQVRQMTRLIDDLLDVSRISRGKINLRRERVDLVEVVNAAIESVRPFVDSQDDELVVDLPEEPVVLTGDFGRLMQVFGNLIHNAAKYTGQHGRIWVAARRENDQAVVTVRDNGPGIPAEFLTQIFEMFVQVDQTLARSHEGLGIDLTLVKRLVDLHGGTIEVLSEGPGRGSEFIVRLPGAVTADFSNNEEADSVPAQRVLLPKRRVLVVDDMKPSANTLALMLKTLGQETRAVYDGRSALAASSEFRPDVVISDIAMPGMD